MHEHGGERGAGDGVGDFRVFTEIARGSFPNVRTLWLSTRGVARDRVEREHPLVRGM